MMPSGVGSYPHRIRLRGPWECSRLPDESDVWRVTMPCRFKEAGLAGYRGTARFARKFGYPGRIDSFEHVWLVCDGCTSCLEVRLNGEQLGRQTDPHFSYDVTAFLGQRNRLEVLIQGDSDESGLWDEVALEIRAGAWLADVHTKQTRTGMRIMGRVMGTAVQPLELYTLVAGRHADYRTIQPCPEGQPFEIDLGEAVAVEQTIRVELVCISSIWYAIELRGE